MKCKICGNRAVIKLRAHNISLCEEHLIEFIERRVERTIKEFRLINKDEKILVPVSGGKDSLNTLFILNALGYMVEGLHINLGIGKYSEESQKKTENFASRYNLKIHTLQVKEILGYSTPEAAKKLRRPACSVCGLVKRYLFNKFAYENNFQVVATGHNLDDEAATLLSNILNWQEGYIIRQNIKMDSTHPKLVKKVKPLALISERESAAYALIRGFDYIREECPFAQGATSIQIKNSLNMLEEESPGTKLRFYKGFLKQNIIKREEKEIKLKECRICGYPTTRDICTFCTMRERFGSKID